jgi:hypothetical protein
LVWNADLPQACVSAVLDPPAHALRVGSLEARGAARDPRRGHPGLPADDAGGGGNGEVARSRGGAIRSSTRMKSGSAIISVGDELLAGQVLDTNASGWARSSASRFSGLRRMTVRDDVDAIADALRRSHGQASVIVVGRGIGPTGDDVTRAGVAKALGVPLVPHPGALDRP